MNLEGASRARASAEWEKPCGVRAERRRAQRSSCTGRR